MTNADATARALSGLAALGALVALVITARAMSKPAPRPTGILAHTIFTFGVLVYGLGRALSGPEGRDLSVDIVGGGMLLLGTIGIVRDKRTALKREAKAGLLET